MIRAFLLGWPLKASLSPVIHNYWLKQSGVNGLYSVISVRPEDLKRKFYQLRDEGFAGGNITIPHKEIVPELCDYLTKSATGVKAVNTVYFEDGQIIGDNSDVMGFDFCLRQCLPFSRLKPKKALVIGAGGAARAVVSALNAIGIRKIHITNRNAPRAQQLKKEFMLDATVPFEQWHNFLSDVDLLVNTTSLGMTGGPKWDHIVLDGLPRTSVVADIVYNPLMTPLLQAASVRGNPIQGGLEMLIGQAVQGHMRWFKSPSVPQLTSSFREHLKSHQATLLSSQ